jgi:REP element-mobilizing transposase RayT
MARARMEKQDGGLYHVYARGNERQMLFRDEADRQLYVRLLAVAVERMGWRLIAYCLMGNHVHLIVETTEGNLGAGMQYLHSRYAMAFNKRYGRIGHLFHRPYGSTVIEDDVHACMTVRYVARNPVEAGLCDRPEDWAWSSVRATLEGRAPAWVDVERLHDFFAWLGGDPADTYAQMVDGARNNGTVTPPAVTYEVRALRPVGRPAGEPSAPAPPTPTPP